MIVMGRPTQKYQYATKKMKSFIVKLTNQLIS